MRADAIAMSPATFETTLQVSRSCVFYFNLCGIDRADCGSVQVSDGLNQLA